MLKEVLGTFRNQPREMWAVFFSMLVNRIGTMALPFLTLYLTQELHFSVTEATSVLAAFGIGAVLMGPVAGWLSDRFGAYESMVLSLISSSVFLSAFPFIENRILLWTTTIFWATSLEIFRPASTTFISSFSTPETKKKNFSLLRLAINLGFAVGPAIGGILVLYSFKALFIVDAITNLIAAVVLMRILKRPLKRPDPSAFSLKTALSFFESLGVILKDRRLQFLLWGFVPIAMIFFQHESTLSVFMTRDLKLSELQYGSIFSLNCLMIVFLELALTHTIRDWNARRAFVTGGLLITVGMGLLYWLESMAGIYFVVILYTLGEMILFPSLFTYLSDIAPEDRKGAYMGFFFSTFNLGFVFGPLAGAWVMERFGPHPLWIACFFTGLIGTFVFSRVREGKPVAVTA